MTTSKQQLEDGPWVYRAKLSGSESHKGYVVGLDGVGIVADVMPLDEDGTRGEKVARMLAASHDLYWALRELLEDVDDHRGRGHAEFDSEEAARAAIARAEGKA
jgi:hypothetical protein